MRLQIPLDDAGSLDVGNVTKERQLQIRLNIFLTLDRVVEEVDEEGQTEPGSQPPDDAEKEGQHFLRLDRSHLSRGQVDNVHVLDNILFLQLGFFQTLKSEIVHRLGLLGLTLQCEVLDALLVHRLLLGFTNGKDSLQT